MCVFVYVNIHHLMPFCTAGNNTPLTIDITIQTSPEDEPVHQLAENELFRHLFSDKNREALSQTLSRKLDTTVTVTNTRIGSIKVDVILADLSSLEYIKELSDNWVLTNIMDSILMTPEFIESCQAEDVSITAVLNEESYQRIKNLPGE